MKINIDGFMRNTMRPGAKDMIKEFLSNLWELRQDPSKHQEFFSLYVFSDDEDYLKDKDRALPCRGCGGLHACLEGSDLMLTCEKYKDWNKKGGDVELPNGPA